MKNIFLILSLVLVFGCDFVETPNGELSEDALESAREYVGTYNGTMEKREASIVLELQGNTPVLSFNDNQNNSILGDACHSEIGKMLGYALKDKRLEAHFALNHQCPSVQGDRVVIHFKKDGQVRLSILKETRIDHQPPIGGGGSACFPTGTGGTSCVPLPGGGVGQNDIRMFYLHGQFSR